MVSKFLPVTLTLGYVTLLGYHCLRRRYGAVRLFERILKQVRHQFHP